MCGSDWAEPRLDSVAIVFSPSSEAHGGGGSRENGARVGEGDVLLPLYGAVSTIAAWSFATTRSS